MRVVLDTHVLLWWLAAIRHSPTSPPTQSPTPTLPWSRPRQHREIRVKKATGRLEAPDDLLDALDENDFDQLPITALHALAAGELPAHHSDPVDRMLIAPAQIEGITLVSVDSRFSAYDILSSCFDGDLRGTDRIALVLRWSDDHRSYVNCDNRHPIWFDALRPAKR